MAATTTTATITTTSAVTFTVDHWDASGQSTPLYTTAFTVPFTYLEIKDPSTTSTSWLTGSPSLATISSTTSDSPTSGASVVASASDTSVSASSTSSSSTKLPSQGGSSNISSGTLAGAVIGSIIGGFLLGLIAAWLLYRRRKESTEGGRPIQPLSKSRDEPETANPTIITTPSRAASDAHFGQFLLDTTPEGEIRSELQALGTLINQHVEHNYHSGPTASHSLLSQALVRLGFSRNAAAIADLCVDPESRPTGIRFVISQTIFRSVDINSLGSASLLPNPVTSFLQAIPQNNHLAFSIALSKWRQVSAFLLHPSSNLRTPLPLDEPSVAPQAYSLATTMNSFLHYFVDEASQDIQTDHLQAVIIECTKFGYTLFSQPQDWQFVFERDGSGQIVVHPGLDKLGGQQSGGRRVLEPETVQARRQAL